MYSCHFRLYFKQQTPTRWKEKRSHYKWKDYRFPSFRSIHQTCVIWQRKCKSRYSRLWNPLPPRSRYISKIDPHSSIHSWSCIFFRQPHTFYTIWITTNYWHHYSKETNHSAESFFFQTGIAPILNITPYTMSFGLKYRLLAITSVIGVEPTYLTTKSGKWLVIVKNHKKNQARQEIDLVINNTILPES